MLILIGASVMIRNFFYLYFRIGELDLAISDYSTALEIDSKHSDE